MNYKCIGCGIKLQTENKETIGYVQNIENQYCERCFRIKNYNEYQKVDKNAEDFYEIIDEINKTDDLTLLVVDIMNIGEELKKLSSRLKNKPLIVVSKRDIFSYKMNDRKLLDLVDLECIDKVAVSSNKNYNMDLLLEKINTYKKSNNVYIIGLTNSGKSTLINKIIYDYTEFDMSVTTSMLPSTTLDTIKIIINDNLTLIDTPGIIDTGNICNYLDNSYLKKIFPKKEIKPITYQIKSRQFIFVEGILKIECEENCDMTFYCSNALKIERFFKDVECDFNKREIVTLRNCDIVINGFGYISVNSKVKLNIYTYDGVEIYLRRR